MSNSEIFFNINVFGELDIFVFCEIQHQIITIYSDGASIQFISENSTVTSRDRIVLTCDATGNPHPVLSWVYDNRILLSSSKLNLSNQLFQSFTMNTSTDSIEESTIRYRNDVNIETVRYKEKNTVEIQLHLDEWPTGEHRFDCVAVNSHGKDERSTFVEHVLEPTFSHENDTLIDVLDGAPVTLNCDVKGYPRPKVSWQKVCKS